MIFPFEYSHNTNCSLDICLIANNLCTKVVNCGIKLHSQPSALNYCHQLKLQWMPNDLDHGGSLLVTREFQMDHEVSYYVDIAVYNLVYCRINLATFLLHVKMLRW